MSGVREKRIFKDVRSLTSIADGDKRHHIITRKDLENIKRDIGKNVTDEHGVKLWIEDMKEQGHFILATKDQNSKYPMLKYKDFFYVLHLTYS